MKRFGGIALIGLGLYLGYGVYFEYNRYSISNGLKHELEELHAKEGNYQAATYYRSTLTPPSWPAIFLYGVASLGCIGAGIAILRKRAVQGR